MSNHTFANDRYQKMNYNRCGKNGLKLPSISLGLWQNFGDVDSFQICRETIRYAFNQGITHFDLANNYGPPPGSAEENFGRILKKDFSGNLRDELIISTKAGYTMWDGPYGDWGSRKYLLSSLDQSLKRMQLDYVDIFYSHRPDPETPLEETMEALSSAVRRGKALYVGISNYKAPEAARAIEVLKRNGTPCLIHQPKYSMFERWVEDSLLDVLGTEGIGCIPFSPLAQGLLTNKYIKGIPNASRAAKSYTEFSSSHITDEKLKAIQELNSMALKRNQSLAQMAIAWLMKDKRVTSVLVGVSSIDQLKDNLKAKENIDFSSEELEQIENTLSRLKS